MIMRIAFFAGLVLLAALPAVAQVRYKDDEGVLHWVDSMDQVPSQYRRGAVGHVGPKGTSAGTNYERQLLQSEYDQARATIVDDCAKRLMTDVPMGVPIENSARRNQWLPDFCRGVSLSEMREANIRRR